MQLLVLRADSLLWASPQLSFSTNFLFTFWRPRRAVKQVEERHRHVEIPALHQSRLVMAAMMFPQLRDDRIARDRMISREVVRQMEPLVGQEKHHRRCRHEHRDVATQVRLDRNRHGQDERQEHEDHGIGWHQDKPPFPLVLHRHVAIGVDHVMRQFMAFVQHTQQRKSSMQDVFVRSPLEAKPSEKRHGDGEKFDGRERIRLKSNECREENTQADDRRDGQVHRRAVTRGHGSHDLRATFRPSLLLVGPVHTRRRYVL